MGEQAERRSQTIEEELAEWPESNHTEIAIAVAQKPEVKPARNWFHLVVLMFPVIAMASIMVWSWRLALFGLGLELWSFGNHASVHHTDTLYAQWWFRRILGLGTWILSIVLLCKYGL